MHSCMHVIKSDSFQSGLCQKLQRHAYEYIQSGPIFVLIDRVMSFLTLFSTRTLYSILNSQQIVVFWQILVPVDPIVVFS